MHPPGDELLPVAFEVLVGKAKDGDGHESDHFDLSKIHLDPLEDPFTAHLTGSSSAASSSAPSLSETGAAHAPTNLREVKVDSGGDCQGLEKRKQWLVAKSAEALFDQ